MDELTEKITNLLNDPEGMSMIKNLAGSLFAKNGNGGGTDKDGAPAAPELDARRLAAVMQLMTALKSETDDDRIRLITALKPHLSPARRKKADNAIKMLKIAKLMPMIKSSGIADWF